MQKVDEQKKMFGLIEMNSNIIGTYFALTRLNWLAESYLGDGASY